LTDRKFYRQNLTLFETSSWTIPLNFAQVPLIQHQIKNKNALDGKFRLQKKRDMTVLLFYRHISPQNHIGLSLGYWG